jgi:hypothetical protein
MQNGFPHNIKHVEIHGLSDIDIELHLGINNEDGEDYANSIREILLEECDIDGQRIFHSIERTLKADTSRAIFSKHNEIMCNSILSDLNNWLSAKFVDTNNNIAFRESVSVQVHTSTIDQRKSQTQVTYNAYASRIAKRFCSENPNEASESFDTAPNRTPKWRINLTYADAAATSSHTQEQDTTHPNADTPIVSPKRTQYTTSVTSSANSSRLVELESSIQSIDSERLFPIRIPRAPIQIPESNHKCPSTLKADPSYPK